LKQDLFLPQDYQKALIKYRNTLELLDEIETNTTIGDFSQAVSSAYNLLHSVQELDKLSERKVAHDINQEIVSKGIKQDLKIELVVRSI